MKIIETKPSFVIFDRQISHFVILITDSHKFTYSVHIISFLCILVMVGFFFFFFIQLHMLAIVLYVPHEYHV